MSIDIVIPPRGNSIKIPKYMIFIGKLLEPLFMTAKKKNCKPVQYLPAYKRFNISYVLFVEYSTAI
jgi:hypothetical protein